MIEAARGGFSVPFLSRTLRSANDDDQPDKKQSVMRLQLLAAPDRDERKKASKKSVRRKFAKNMRRNF